MPELKPVSVMFAEDHEVVREALVALFSSNPKLKVVGQCGNRQVPILP